METSMYGRITIACSIIVLASPSIGKGATQQRRGSCLGEIEAHFGTPVGRWSLFEIDEYYAIEVGFGPDCNIERVKIAPKYEWQNEVVKWTEPDHQVSLSARRYEDILTWIGRLRSLGAPSKKDDTGARYVQASKTEHWDLYTGAIINRVMWCCPGDENRGVFSVSIYFCHKVWARASASRRFTTEGGIEINQIRIGRDWYVACDTEFRKARSKKGKMYLAGPMF